MSTIPLGPWPLGMDKVHARNHRVFQVPGQGQPPARLLAATDVDIDDEGWPSARSGTSLVEPVIGGRRIVSAGASTLLQANDCLYLDGVLVADGLIGVVEAVEHTDQIYWADWEKRGRIQGGIAKNWGAAICPAPIGQAGNWQIFVCLWIITQGGVWAREVQDRPKVRM